MIKYITHKNNIFAIVVRKKDQFKKKGVDFLTKGHELLQLGCISHKKNHVIKSHINKKQIRKIEYSSEVLILKKGVLKVKFYDKKNINIKKDILLYKDDIILLFKGGHGFEVIQDVNLIEIKQGPYKKSQDKILI